LERTIPRRNYSSGTLFEDDTQREVMIDSLKADCEIRAGRPAGL
jgi:hypothetical protein